MKRYASFDYESSNEDNNIKTSPQTSSPQTLTTTTATTTTTSATNTSNNTISQNVSNGNNIQIAKRMLPCSNKIGNYIIGPKLNGSFNYGSLLTPYLCRKDNSKDFFILKVS